MKVDNNATNMIKYISEKVWKRHLDDLSGKEMYLGLFLTVNCFSKEHF